MARSVARDIDHLPYWARVAFAARCGRLTLPLFAKAWPSAEPSRIDSLRHAIEFAERSAADGQVSRPTETPVMKAMATAGAAIASLYGLTGSGQSSIGETNSIIAHYVAKAAESAARSAEDGANKSCSWALTAYTFARDAAQAAKEPGILKQQESDFAGLCRVVRNGRWSDTTAVPPDIFELLSMDATSRPFWKF